MWWCLWAVQYLSSKWRGWSSCAPRVFILSSSVSVPGKKKNPTTNLCNPSSTSFVDVVVSVFLLSEGGNRNERKANWSNKRNLFSKCVVMDETLQGERRVRNLVVYLVFIYLFSFTKFDLSHHPHPSPSVIGVPGWKRCRKNFPPAKSNPLEWFFVSTGLKTKISPTFSSYFSTHTVPISHI